MSHLGHERLLRWVGLRADDRNGARVGRVEAILVDRENGTPNWLLIRLPQRHGFVVAPLHRFPAGGGHLLLPQSRAQLLKAPRVPESGRLTARLERLLCSLFAIPPTRGAALSDWERRATSARLVEPGRWEPEPRGTSQPIPVDLDFGAIVASGPASLARRPALAPRRQASPRPNIPAPPVVLPPAREIVASATVELTPRVPRALELMSVLDLGLPAAGVAAMEAKRALAAPAAPAPVDAPIAARLDDVTTVSNRPRPVVRHRSLGAIPALSHRRPVT